MVKNELTANEKAINDFFEGYEADTLKEYGNTLFTLVSILKENESLSQEFEKDTFSKLMALHRLISELNPTGIKSEYSLN